MEIDKIEIKKYKSSLRPRAVFEKIKKKFKTLAGLIKKKRERIQINKIRVERGDITVSDITDITVIQS